MIMIKYDLFNYLNVIQCNVIYINMISYIML